MEIYEIGFNDQVSVGGRGFHIQTEVLGKREFKVKSTVLEGGAIKHVASRLWPSTIGVDQLQELAEAQHQQTVDKVLRGDVE